MTPSPKEIPGHITLTGTITGQTPKAIRFTVDTVEGDTWDGVQKSFWIPISQTHSHFESNEMGNDWIIISNWIADKLGFV